MFQAVPGLFTRISCGAGKRLSLIKLMFLPNFGNVRFHHAPPKSLIRLALRCPVFQLFYNFVRPTFFRG